MIVYILIIVAALLFIALIVKGILRFKKWRYETPRTLKKRIIKCEAQFYAFEGSKRVDLDSYSVNLNNNTSGSLKYEMDRLVGDFNGSTSGKITRDYYMTQPIFKFRIGNDFLWLSPEKDQTSNDIDDYRNMAPMQLKGLLKYREIIYKLYGKINKIEYFESFRPYKSHK